MDTEENHALTTEKNDSLVLTGPTNLKTLPRLQAVLDIYSKTGKLMEACAQAGINHNTHYRKMGSDPAYRAAFEKAERQCVQRLEDTAYERAMAGDNTLLVVLLKRFKPEHYRERASVDVTLTVNLADRLTQARQRLIALERGESAA
jgi:hypothetical protein